MKVGLTSGAGVAQRYLGKDEEGGMSLLLEVVGLRGTDYVAFAAGWRRGI